MSIRKNRYTDEEVAFLVVGRAQRKSFTEISREMKEKFGHSRSASSLSIKYNTLMDGKKPFISEFTNEQKTFLASCYLNNFTDAKIIEAYFEFFNYRMNNHELTEALKVALIDAVVFESTIEREIAQEDEIEKEIETLKTKIKESKKMKRNNWTKEEDEQLLACGTWKKAMELQNGRSRTAKNNRWALLQKKTQKKGAKRGRMTKAELEMIRNCKTVEEALALNLRKPETIIRQFTTFNSKKKEVVLAVEPKQKKKKTKQTYSPRWTKEEDYDLVLNFYELSIDEARNRFNRSYGAIATRLERIVDSTKPEHISMLMEASKEIKARKETQTTTPQKSRRTLRKERKQAKKTAKLEAKLNRLRGE